jgi:hypothetical protein
MLSGRRRCFVCERCFDTGLLDSLVSFVCSEWSLECDEQADSTTMEEHIP